MFAGNTIGKNVRLKLLVSRSEIKGFPNPAISHPESVEVTAASTDDIVASILKNVNAHENVGRWFNTIFNALHAEDDSIWANPGEIYIGLYSPEKSFASVKLQANSIRIECFSGGQLLEKTKISSEKFSPRWAKFSVKSDNDVKHAIEILKESRRRLKEAIKRGEPTAYFSGGVFASNSSVSLLDDTEGKCT